jgi:Bacterial Ig-like domain (group 3)/Repulsive guidance molecule (RGM) C-terminus
MAVLMSLGGNSAGDGFLVAPLGTTYDAEITLKTDTGTATVTLQASPNPANLVFSTTGPISLSTTPKVVTVHALLQSATRGDTTIQVLEGTTVVVSFKITSIKHPVVNFNGRFQARFATDSDLPYINPIYTDTASHSATDDVVPLSQGYTFGLEGEPNFVPVTGTVPTKLDMTGVGRNVRLNNPVALRSQAPLVASAVDSISGETTTGTETFTAGDPLIGQPVNFGPDTYMAGNTDDVFTVPGNPAPEEYWHGGSEPLALFEIYIGAAFSPPAIYFTGASQIGPFTHKATAYNQRTRTPDSRPTATFYSLPDPSLPPGVGDLAAIGLPTDLNTFATNRINNLLVEYAALPSGPSLQRRNLVRRISHLLGSLDPFNPTTPTEIMNVQAKAVAPDVFSVRTGQGNNDYAALEQYTGKVDTALHAWPGGSPGASSVVAYLTQFFSFDFEWDPFAFSADELCGYHTGTLSGDLSMTGNHIGDPHVTTVNGTHYDFQGVGEFTLLRDGDRIEIQVRQTPVPTAHPATDSYTGLTECVSINTAVAAWLGAHRIAFQPGPVRDRQQMEFYVDGKPANMPTDGIDLGGSRVTVFAANGESGIRLDFEDGSVMLVTPIFWSANSVWYLDVSVSNTSADEGVMGFIPKGSWLPRLRNGTDVGPMPASLHDRYVTLYKTFADSWRVTDKTSLFVYAPGTSTNTFTDTDWPEEKPPCKLKPQFQIPGVKVHQGMPVERAEAICRVVTDKNLFKSCVFDVATTGDEIFAKGYVFAEETQLYSTSVKITCHQAPGGRPYQRSVVAANVPAQPEVRLVVVTATVSPLTPGRPIPTGTVTVFVDGVAMNRPTALDDRGRARVKIAGLKPGEHKIRAAYSGGGKFDYHSSSSASLVYDSGKILP